jgi:hypothetical protein
MNACWTNASAVGVEGIHNDGRSDRDVLELPYVQIIHTPESFGAFMAGEVEKWGQGHQGGRGSGPEMPRHACVIR